LSGLNLAYDYALMEDNKITLDILNKVIKLTRYRSFYTYKNYDFRRIL